MLQPPNKGFSYDGLRIINKLINLQQLNIMMPVWDYDDDRQLVAGMHTQWQRRNTQGATTRTIYFADAELQDLAIYWTRASNLRLARIGWHQAQLRPKAYLLIFETFIRQTSNQEEYYCGIKPEVYRTERYHSRVNKNKLVRPQPIFVQRPSEGIDPSSSILVSSSASTSASGPSSVTAQGSQSSPSSASSALF